MTMGEGAEMGGWMFTSAPVNNGTRLLCVLGTRKFMLRMEVPVDCRDDALIAMLKAVGEA